MLNSRYPMFLWWGEELYNLYNDAYISVLGQRHPDALAQPAATVWREIWQDVGPMARQVMGEGISVWHEQHLLMMERHGYREETYFTFSYSPVPDEQGRPGGVTCTCTEETDRVIEGRRLSLLRELGAELAAVKTEDDLFATTQRQLANRPQDTPFALVYQLEQDGRGARLACAHGDHLPPGRRPEFFEVDAPDAPWPIQEILEHPGVVAVPLDPDLAPDAAVPIRQALVAPIGHLSGPKPDAFLVVGLNPYRPPDAAYRGFVFLLAGQIAAALSNIRTLAEERRRLEALAELDRAKSEFFSNVSHEFRTPLTLMLGPLEELLTTGSGELRPAVAEQLRMAHRNGRRLLRLVNTLLDFARVEAGRLHPQFELVDAAALTEEFAAVFRSVVENAGLEFSVDCDPGLPALRLDRGMWEKIIFNLLSNAYKFTFQGAVRLSLRREDEQIVLTVQDTGVGIPAAELPNLFKRFHRVHGSRSRTHEGTGIGLALVQELVRLHEGAIDVHSEQGQGTTFSVRLPIRSEGDAFAVPARPTEPLLVPEELARWSAPVAAPAEASNNEPDTKGPRASILLVDDNADMRAYLEHLLGPDYDVHLAADGQAALEMLRAGSFELVLTDVMMPRLDGLGLLRAIRSDPTLQLTPVVLISARAGGEASAEAFDARADDYLVKPFSARELLSRVRAHVHMARVRRRERELTQQAKVQLAHANLLSDISARVGGLEQESQILQVATEMLGRYLQASHCHFIEASPQNPAELRVSYDWRSSSTTASVTGKFSLDAYGTPEWRQQIQNGRLVIESVATHPLTQGFAQAYEELGILSYCSAAILRGGAWAASLVITSQTTRAWKEEEVALVENVAARVWPWVERARAEEALRASEQQLHGILSQIPAGVYTTDQRGRIQFYNTAAAELWGHVPALGQEGDTVVRICRPDGSPANTLPKPDGALSPRDELILERADGTRRHVLVYPQPIRDSAGETTGAVNLLIDVTEQKRRERHDAVLAELSRRLALLGSEVEIVRETTRVVGEHLEVARCYFAEPGTQPDTIVVRDDWAREGVPSVAGEYDRAEFGAIEWWEACPSQSNVLTDVVSDEQTKPYAARFQALGIRSCVLVPHSRDKRLVALFIVADEKPRRWTDDELDLLENVTARVWPLVERARAAAALRESEHRFRNMAEHSPVIMWIADATGYCHYLNKAWYDYTGQSVSDSAGYGWLQAIHVDDRAPTEEALLEAATARRPLRLEYRVRRVDGVYRWALNAAAPRFGRDGEFLGFIGSVIDITESKEEELSAQARADRVRLALAASNSGDWSWDAATDIVTLSPRAADIFGVAPGPVITWTALRGLLDEHDAERARRSVEQALVTRSDYDIEYRILRPFGGVSWVAARGRGVYSESGEVLGMIGVIQEINGRKRAEQALLDREQRMNRLMSLMPAGIYTCDAQGRITFFNKRAVNLWGREPLPNMPYAEFSAQLPSYSVEGRPLPLDRRPMSVALRERRGFRDAESILERPDGTRWVISNNIDALHDGDGRFAGTISVFLDITERKRAENLIAGQSRALQLLASAAPLEAVLTELVRTIEQNHEGVAGFVMQYDATHHTLRHGAAPSLPDAYNRAVDGIPVRPDVGTCSQAAARRQLVITRDIENAASWVGHQQHPLGVGLRAVWSMPILGKGDVLLGTIGGYYRECREPSAAELATTRFLARTAAISIERHRAEEAVRAAEAQLRLITDISPVMLTQCDAQRRFMFASRAYLERRGLKAQDVVGRNFADVVGPEAYEQIKPYVDLVLAGVRVDYEIEIEFPRLGRRWLSVSHVPDRDPAGVVRGWVTALNDITENKRADAATRQLAAIVESSEDAIISKSLDGIITSWNRGAERLFGYTAIEMIGQSILRIVPPDRVGEEPRIARGVRQGERIDHFETVRLHRDGHPIDVSLTVSPIRDAQGRTVGVSKIARDITERKRQEEELRRREQLYRGIGESINYGIWVCDATGRNVYASESLLKLIGQTQEEFSGDGWVQALHPDQRETTARDWAACVKSGAVWEAEYLLQGADGQWHPVLSRGVPVRDDRGHVTSWAGINLDVAAYKRAEEALRQSETRFREIADNIPLFAWMAEPDGRVYWYNQRWTEYTGLRLGDMPTNGDWSLVHPDHQERVQERYRQMFREGKVWEDTFPMRGREGGYRWFLSRAVPIRDESGGIRRWFGTNTDITELRSAQEVLAERTHILETLNRVGNALVAELDLERIVQTVTDAGREVSRAAFGAFYFNVVNERGERQTLFTVSGASREDLAELRRLQGSELFGARLRDAGVVRLNDLSDEWFWGDTPGENRLNIRSFLAVPVISRAGELLGGLCFGHARPGIFNDTSEKILAALAAQAAIAIDNANLYAALQRELAQQKRADAALRASERQLRLVTDHATVYLVLIDRAHRFKFANRPYAQRFGREPYEILGLHVADIEGHAAYDLIRQHLQLALSGQRVDYELEIPYPSLGPRWMHIVYVPERTLDGEVVGLLGVLNDITSRKQVEREVEIARDRALAASRAKDDFLAALSHELRTPLNPVLLLASEAAENETLAPEIRDSFLTIRNNVELEARLIDDLLDLTRISRGKLPLDLRIVDVHAIVHAALETVDAEVNQKQLDVVLKLDRAPAHVWGDAVRLQQIFWNVLKNAVKFTPARGRLEVSSFVDVAAGSVQVRVTDTGIGLTSTELARIFDAFVQGDHAGSGGSHRFGGVGLGLAISQMLAEQHHGTIRAESPGRDQGATFVIELPLATPASELSRPEDRKGGGDSEPVLIDDGPARRTSRPRRVLLVEDHEPTRVTLSHVLSRRGLVVTCAASLAEARETAAKTEFDLLISDIGLPDGSGCDLMTELSAVRPIVGIALSGYGMEEDIARSQRAGFRQHLTKPVRVQLLDRALAELWALSSPSNGRADAPGEPVGSNGR